MMECDWLNIDDEDGGLAENCGDWWRKFQRDNGQENAIIAVYRMIEDGGDREIGKKRLVRLLSLKFWEHAGALLNVDPAALSRGEFVARELFRKAPSYLETVLGADEDGAEEAYQD
jgi:hypothetical protein